MISEGKGLKGEDGKISPPGAVIRFDATHPKDDGKLAGEYAEGEQINQEEAHQQVLELVDAIKFKLDKGETYRIDLVGEFSRDDDNKIHFQKDPNWVIDPGIFGLSSLDLPELEKEEEPAEAAETETETAEGVAVDTASSTGTESTEGEADESVDGKATGDGTATEEEVSETEEEMVTASTSNYEPWNKTEQEKTGRRPSRRWTIIWIVTGALIVALAVVLLIPSENGLEIGKEGVVIRNTEIGDENEEGTAATSAEDQKTQDAEEGNISNEQELTEKEQEMMQEPETTPRQENKYFIIAGSFRSLMNASEMVEDLKASGYPAEIILTENRLYRVALQSFATKQEALDALPGFKATEGMENAWLLTR